MIKFVGQTTGSSISLGSATLPTGVPVVLGSLAGMFYNHAADLYVNLTKNNIQLYDENVSVITDRSSSFYQELTEAISAGRPIKPKLSEAHQIAMNYLEETDWYVERLNDPSSGKEIPEVILLMRAEARIVLSS